MKNISLLLIFITFLSCGSNDQIANCFPSFTFNETINLNNPQFNELQVPGSSVSFTISSRNILIIRRNTSTFKAFDLQCPELDCTSSMDFDGLKLTCPCSNKEYSSLNGTPVNGDGCLVLEYNVFSVGNNVLQITR